VSVEIVLKRLKSHIAEVDGLNDFLKKCDLGQVTPLTFLFQMRNN
jgi:hypothetical protein